MVMREIKLKPCPFCGGPAVIRSPTPYWLKEKMWAAGCAAGHAESPEMQSKLQAAEWWNRRTKGARREQ